MRYAALNQGMDQLASFNGFIPRGKDFKTLPDLSNQIRYSDEQLAGDVSVAQRPD
ncbi:MAG: hypothetical protein IPO77_03750 [Acidobacteria bacterium]|nr:hypothetical protein [Acidobacteriota bacterium]